MLIDSKGKLFGKISIIDILIVLVIIAGAAGVLYKFKFSKTASIFNKPDDIQIVFYAEEVPEYATKSVQSGDMAKDPVKNAVFGKVKEVLTDKSVSFAQNEKGEIVVSSKAGYASVKISVEGKGIYTNNGVTFDNADYSVGKQMELRAGNSSLWVRIYDIKKIKG